MCWDPTNNIITTGFTNLDLNTSTTPQLEFLTRSQNRKSQPSMRSQSASASYPHWHMGWEVLFPIRKEAWELIGLFMRQVYTHNHVIWLFAHTCPWSLLVWFGLYSSLLFVQTPFGKLNIIYISPLVFSRVNQNDVFHQCEAWVQSLWKEDRQNI